MSRDRANRFCTKEKTTSCQGFSLREVIFSTIVSKYGCYGVRAPNLLNEIINSIILGILGHCSQCDPTYTLYHSVICSRCDWGPEMSLLAPEVLLEYL